MTTRDVDAREESRRYLTDATPALVWSVDARGRVTYFNRRWTDFTGLDPAQLRRGGVAAISHPDDYAAAKRLWQQRRAGSRPFEMEYRLRSRSGDYRWHVARAEPFRAADGSIAGWVGVCSDIHEQKRAAAHLQFLSDAGDALSAAQSLSATLERIAELAVPAIAEWCAVFLMRDGGDLEVAAFAHENPEKVQLVRRLVERHGLPVGENTRRVLETGQPVLLSEFAPDLAAQGAHDTEHHDALVALDVRSGIVVPLAIRGEVFGTVQFAASGSGRRFDEADLSLAKQLARRASLAIDNARLLESRQRGIARLRFLAEVGETLSDSLDLETRLERLVRFVVPSMATWATVNLLNDDGAIETVAVAHRDVAMAPLVERLRGPFYGRELSDEGTPAVIRSGRALVIDPVDEAYLERAMRPEKRGIIRQLGARSALVVPLVAHGRMHGTLSALRTADDPRFTANDVPLFEEIARRAAVAIENARLFARQQRVSEGFQKASLPTTLPKVPGFAFHGFYEPGKSEARIGGDWYDAFILGDGRVVVSIGDVAGSGLGAAVIMGSVRQVIRGAAQLDTDPAVILDATDRALRAEHPERVVTAFVGVIDPKARTLQFASAGHPPPLLRSRDGRLTELTCVGLPLGLRRGAQSAATVTLDPGAAVLLYTDGITESTRDVVEGERRLREALSGVDVLDAPDVARAVFERVLYDGSSDDVAILAILVLDGARGYTVSRRLRTDAPHEARQVLAEVLDTLRRSGATEADCEAATLVFMELLGNAVRHAPGEIEVALDNRDERPVLHVFDEGPGFDYAASRGPADPLCESGRGLFLVAHHASHFHVRRRAGGGTHATAVLALGQDF